MIVICYFLLGIDVTTLASRFPHWGTFEIKGVFSDHFPTDILFAYQGNYV